MDWIGVLKGSLFSAVCLAGALWLLRSARQKAERHQRRTLYIPPDRSEFVRCTFGDHAVSRRRAVHDGETYDGGDVFICHRHRFERKRLLNAREAS